MGKPQDTHTARHQGRGQAHSAISKEVSAPGTEFNLALYAPGCRTPDMWTPMAFASPTTDQLADAALSGPQKYLKAQRAG